MAKNIAIILGHPDKAAERFCRALALAYKEGAADAGHRVQLIDLAEKSFPWLTSKVDYETALPPPAIGEAQTIIRSADHLVFVFPLWLGDMPALLKAFLEQTFRPGFAYAGETNRGMPEQFLKGKSARIVITMGMPSFVYRFYFGAHGLKVLKRNILAFCGVKPIRDTIIGMVEAPTTRHERWLQKMRQFGYEGI